VTIAPRSLVGLAASAWVVSTAFPVVASLLRAEEPLRALGVADVAVAAVTVALGVSVAAKKPAGFDARVSDAAVRVYRAAANTCLVLLVVFFLAGDRVRWNVLLPGLAWRAWFFAWVLPSAIALWQGQAREAHGAGTS
jgi:hypothetical protein